MSRSGGSIAVGGIAGVGEVLLGELQLSGGVAVGLARELVRLDRQRLVPVGADAVGIAPLAEVHRAILVAQDRVLDLDVVPASSATGTV